MIKMSFEMAMAALKGGKIITREAWQHKKCLRLHPFAGKESIWRVEPKKRTTTWTRVERIKIEDIMAEDWVVVE